MQGRALPGSGLEDRGGVTVICQSQGCGEKLHVIGSQEVVVSPGLGTRVCHGSCRACGRAYSIHIGKR